MKQNFRRLLLCLSLAAAPFMRTQALDWVPVGGGTVDGNTYGDITYKFVTDTDGNAATYSSGDVIGSGHIANANEGFDAHTGNNTLNIYGTVYSAAPSASGTQVSGPIPCSLKVNDDVEIRAQFSDMIVNIKEDVVLEPYYKAADTVPGTLATESTHSHIYFKAEAGKTITVNVDHNLEFRGKTVDADNFRDLLVSFAGAGQVIFKMKNGTSIWFNGQVDTSNHLILDKNGLLLPCADRTDPTNNAAGTKVFVLMDQTQADVDAGKNKVVFQRKSYAAEDNDQRVLIGVGHNSVFTYLSTNDTGLAQEGDDTGYGAVGFDPFNLARGRMVLFIRGAYAVDTNKFKTDEPGEVANDEYGLLLEKYPFNDGAVIVGGHYVAGFSASDISFVTEESEVSAPGYDFSKPAGIRAIMRVVDNSHYTGDSATALQALADNRRGLLVVNDVASHGKLMADPYWDLYTTTDEGYKGINYAPSNIDNSLNNRRKGFILAVNGELDIYHNTFMHHVSGFANLTDSIASCDFADPDFLGDANWLKQRNPSALIVDGLDPALFVNGNPTAPETEGHLTPSAFEAANPYSRAVPTQARVKARGNGTLYTSAAASSKWGYIRNFWTSVDLGVASPLDDATIDYTTIFNLGTTGDSASDTFDGTQLDPSNNEDVVASGEGVHVLDVEGPVEFVGVGKNTTPNGLGGSRSYTDTDASGPEGSLCAPSLLISYTGREVIDGDEVNGGTLVSRPLVADGTSYSRYNSPTLFFNNFASFNNAVLKHTDVTKYVDGIPSLSEPAVTGGERNWFGKGFWGDSDNNKIADPNRFRLPEIQLFNSTLELHENLNASGVRFVVKDIPFSEEADNLSRIKFYDHGDQLDTNLTGYGRIFMCGSSLNNFSDGASNAIGESCCFNVFKTTRTPDVKLSIINGDEFSTDIQDAMALTPGLKASKQRAHHLFMFSQPPHSSDGAVANMAIGWGSLVKDGLAKNTMTYAATETHSAFDGPAADQAIFPGSFPYPGTEPIVTDATYYTADLVSLDALQHSPATVSIDGSIICFGSFDQNGASLPVPVKTDNDSGVVYVKHGGKLTTTRPDGSLRTSGTSVPNQSVFSTTIAQRLWNDYDNAGIDRVVKLSGAVDLPHDQVTFDKNMGVQVYNISKDMFAARRYDTSGYVRLGFEDTSYVPSLAHPYVDRSGAEEVSVGWFYRDCPDFTVTGSTTVAITDGNPAQYAYGATGGNVLPVKAYKAGAWTTRALESVGTPSPRPLDLLYVGPGDDVKQMKIAGATMSDPFILDVSGDSTRPVNARVREFVSLKSTRDQLSDHFIGEGAHAVLFTEFGGRIGLGNRKWNEHSVNAWNILGKDYVTLCPLGDGVVDLNDNVLVADRQALIASTDFSASGVNRLTFYSNDPREIRIPAGGELDLSSFGQSANRQEIAFGGKVRLVIETGATIRFPDAESIVGGVVLYFNDQAELIFEGTQDPSTFKPFNDSGAPINNARIKLVGKGQIWLNKESRIRVNGSTFVGVETDELSTATDVTISIQRQGRMDIGDENVSGGAFQVGNPTDNGGTVAFTLALNGPRATFHIDREGFFGLGAGVFNKNGKPNGSASSGANPEATDGVADQGSANGDLFFPTFHEDGTDLVGSWTIKPLANVTNVTVTVQNGIFDHSNIYDGSTSNASLMAIGPVSSSAVWKQGNQDVAFVRGGGNLMFVPSSGSFKANIWDYAGTLVTGEAYGILAAGQMLLDRGVAGDMDQVNDATVADFNAPGKSFTLTGTPGSDLFGLLSYKPFNLQGALAGSAKRVCVGATAFVTSMAYTTQDTTKYPATSFAGAEIRRQGSPASIGGGTMAEAVERGALNAIGDTQPTNLTANA